MGLLQDGLIKTPTLGLLTVVENGEREARECVNEMKRLKFALSHFSPQQRSILTMSI